MRRCTSMPSEKELNKELMERLYDLLVVKNSLPKGLILPELNKAIRRASAAMTKEQIKWVEELAEMKD